MILIDEAGDFVSTEINTKKIPADALSIISTLEAEGYEAWLVGGCVRDLMLNRAPVDWDITTSALPEAVQACFPHTVPTGIAHGTVTVLMGKTPYEVTTYRSESEYSDFRRPDQVFFVSSIEEDLARRDFTINAMAWHPSGGLADPFGGVQDLESKIIRAVGNPVERFGEDALRMLRAVRFAAQLDFVVEPVTLKAITEGAAGISYVSGERVRVELDKWLMSAGASRWPLLRESGLMGWVLPELDRCFDMPQRSPWHFESVGEHTLRAVAYAQPERVIRWALLFHDLGKCDMHTVDDAGVDHFYGHEARGEELARVIMNRLHWDNRTTERVLRLVRHHDRDVEPSERAVRRAVKAIGREEFPYWLKVRRADRLAQRPEKAAPQLVKLDEVEALYEHIIEEEHCLHVNELAVTGKDILAMGVPQGPLIGRVQHALLEWVLEEPQLNTHAQLMIKAAEIYEKMAYSKK